MTEKYIDIREIHPSFAKAKCKHCDETNYGYRVGVERHGFTLCKTHNPLKPKYPALGYRGEWVTVKL